ncbi:MAG: hypothetical protein JO179_03960 [Solirubrobacterales bacterium]|nr:hypothetical protein [Solirubrobacterales bacterium]
MTVNPHIMQAIGRERTADRLRAAAAYRSARQADQTRPAGQPVTPPQPGVSARQDLIPAGIER